MRTPRDLQCIRMITCSMRTPPELYTYFVDLDDTSRPHVLSDDDSPPRRPLPPLIHLYIEEMDV